MPKYIITATDKAKYGRTQNLEVRLLTEHPYGLEATAGAPETKSKKQVVDLIRRGNEIITATWHQGTRKWIFGKPVDFNLYSHADNKPSNNLGALPNIAAHRNPSNLSVLSKEYLVTACDKIGPGKNHRAEVRPFVLQGGRRVVDGIYVVTSGWVIDAIHQNAAFKIATHDSRDNSWYESAVVSYSLCSHADGKRTNNLDELPAIGQAQNQFAYGGLRV